MLQVERSTTLAPLRYSSKHRLQMSPDYLLLQILVNLNGEQWRQQHHLPALSPPHFLFLLQAWD